MPLRWSICKGKTGPCYPFCTSENRTRRTKGVELPTPAAVRLKQTGRPCICCEKKEDTMSNHDAERRRLYTVFRYRFNRNRLRLPDDVSCFGHFSIDFEAVGLLTFCCCAPVRRRSSHLPPPTGFGRGVSKRCCLYFFRGCPLFPPLGRAVWHGLLFCCFCEIIRRFGHSLQLLAGPSAADMLSQYFFRLDTVRSCALRKQSN